MKEKIIGIIVCMLLIATALPAVGFVENNLDDLSNIPEINIFRDIVSSQNYKDTYSVQTHHFVPGEFIVKFKSEAIIEPTECIDGVFRTGVASIDTLNEKNHVFFGERVFDSFTHLERENHDLWNVFTFQVPKTADILSLINEYSLNPYVCYAEPNYLVHSCVTPNDPYFNLQYALHNTGQTGGTPDADIDAPEAWDIETGDENIVIAVPDSGVDWDHPDLEENIWVNPGEDLNGNGVVDPSDFNNIDDDENGFIDDIRGWDFVDTNDTVAPGEDGTIRDNDPMDFIGHGTLCSGIASAVTNNNIGIAGVCWKCNIMPIKMMFLKETGMSAGEMDDVAAGLIYAADNGAHIMSMSWGTYENSQLLYDTITYTYLQGMILVSAAGNEDVNQPSYPPSYECVIAVAATDHKDNRADYSNWGSCYGSWVDVSAPGSNIRSTLFNDTYGSDNGTSLSTPLVAGIIGLMLSKNPGLSQDEVRTILKSTTDPVDSEFFIGTGRVNAYKALQRDSSPVAFFSSTLDDAHVSGVISIIGTAVGTTFVNYSVWYGLGVYPDTWTEIQTSTTPVANDIIATWDTTTLIEDETYSLCLLVYDSNGYISKDQVLVIIDNEPNTGWTLQWTTSLGGPRAAQTRPIGDIDEDGINEIFISSSYEFGSDGVCRIMSYNESQASYILESSFTINSAGYWRHPLGLTVIDLDDDGDLEFCLAWGDTYSDGIYAYDWDGTTLTYLDRYSGTGFDFSYGVSAGDYDDDGDVELLCANDPHWYSGTNHVTALGWDNVNDRFVEEAFWALPGHMDKGCWETISGDTDNDRKNEVIVTVSDWDSSQTAGTYALNWNEVTEEWEHEPVSTDYPTAAPCGLALGDLNGNGIPEIAVGSGSWYGGGKAIVWLYEWNGTEYEEVWNQEYPGEDDIHNAIDIGDVDNDGTNELCVGTDIVHIYSWDGTDYVEEATLTESRHRLISLNIGDCDSDGLNEIKTGQRASYSDPGNIGSEFIYKYIPVFDIDIQGGLGVKAVIKNNGKTNITDITWEIQVKGGILGLIKKTVNGIIDIPAEGFTTVKTKILLGLGPITISIKVAEEEKSMKGKQFFIFSIV